MYSMSSYQAVSRFCRRDADTQTPLVDRISAVDRPSETWHSYNLRLQEQLTARRHARASACSRASSPENPVLTRLILIPIGLDSRHPRLGGGFGSSCSFRNPFLRSRHTCRKLAHSTMGRRISCMHAPKRVFFACRPFPSFQPTSEPEHVQ